MPSPFIAEKGVIRLSPLEKAVAARSTSRSTGGNGAHANRASADPTVSPKNATKTDIIDPVTGKIASEQDIAEAKAKAASGDQTSIDWLSTLGIVGTTAVAGALAARKVSKDVGKNFVDPAGQRSRVITPKTMGADKIATDAASPNATSAVAKKVTPPKTVLIDPAGQRTPLPQVKSYGIFADPAGTNVKMEKPVIFTPKVSTDVIKGIRRVF